MRLNQCRSPHDIGDIRKRRWRRAVWVLGTSRTGVVLGGQRGFSPVDWKFHSTLVSSPILSDCRQQASQRGNARVFRETSENHGIVLEDEQMAFGVKRREQGDDIWQQYPSQHRGSHAGRCSWADLPAACQPSAGRASVDFEPERAKLCSPSTGASGQHGRLVTQPCGKKTGTRLIGALARGVGAEAVAEVIRAWNGSLVPMAGVYIPHDANVPTKGAARLTFPTLARKINLGSFTLCRAFPTYGWALMRFGKRLGRPGWHSRTDRPVVTPDGDKLPPLALVVWRITEGHHNERDYQVDTVQGWRLVITLADALRTWRKLIALHDYSRNVVDAALRTSRPVTQMRAMMDRAGGLSPDPGKSP